MRKYPGGYRKGQWKVECDRCGCDFRSGQMRREWTGLMVCHGPGTNDCYDERHPQDFLRGKKDDQSVPWASPASEKFIAGNLLDTQGRPIYDTQGRAIYDSNGVLPEL